MQPVQTISVLLVDKRTLMRSGISLLLSPFPDLHVLGQAASAEEALALAEAQRPDVVVSDADLPGTLSSLDLIRSLRKLHPSARVLLLTDLYEPALIQQVISEGAAGYLLNTITIEELVRAIRAAHDDAPIVSPEITQTLGAPMGPPVDLLHHLTGREQQVLRLLARGWNNQKIAAELNISLSTVQFHTGNIFSKLQVHNRTEAAAFALRHEPGAGQSWMPGELAS